MKNLIYIDLAANSSDTALMLELHEKYPEFSTSYIIIGEIGDYPQAKLERYHLTFSPLKKGFFQVQVDGIVTDFPQKAKEIIKRSNTK